MSERLKEPVLKTGTVSDYTASQTTPDKTFSDSRGNDAPGALAFLAPESPDLAAAIDAWPTLSEAVKAGVVAMVKAASETGPDDGR